MKRVLIIGGNGSGKTTFAKSFAAKVNLPLVHLDSLYWRDGWQHVSESEFDELLQKELDKPEWILDGNMRRTLAHRLKYCDTVIYFDFSRIVCVWGAVRRVILNYGRSRPDMGGYCPERFEWKFIKSIWTSDREVRNKYYALLDAAKDVEVIVLKNRSEVRRYLNSLQKKEL
jgi:adenylate kinase family enzyme